MGSPHQLLIRTQIPGDTVSDILSFIDNDLTISTQRYAAILGLSPSKGARSPLLWNTAFASAGIDAVMHPMDVSEDNLASLVAALKADPRYVGGAVALPHKQGLVALLDRLEPEAERIGAVNAIYRDGDDLVGANTDGAGALQQLEESLGDLSGIHAVLLGLGGAGIAVAAYLAGAVKSLRIANRTPARAEAAAVRLGTNVSAIAMPPSGEALASCDLLVNCTSIGFQDGTPGSPLGEASVKLMAALPESAMAYDIIYQPAETAFLAQARTRGLKTLNGIGMNRDQAVIAFEKANPGALSLDQIRTAMANAG